MPHSIYIQTDCSTHEGCDSLVKEVIHRCGRLDLLVCALAKGQVTSSNIWTKGIRMHCKCLVYQTIVFIHVNVLYSIYLYIYIYIYILLCLYTRACKHDMTDMMSLTRTYHPLCNPLCMLSICAPERYGTFKKRCPRFHDERPPRLIWSHCPEPSICWRNKCSLPPELISVHLKIYRDHGL